jgi:subtilase family serine protease
VYKNSRIRHLAAGLLAAGVASIITTATAAASTATGNVAPWVAKATKLGAAPATTSVTVAIHLKLQNTAGLKTLVASLSSPKSPEYGHYLTPQQFSQRFAPATADVQAAKALLEHGGMTDVTVGPDGVYVSATATVAQLRTTFNVSQNLYSYQGHTLRANVEEPTIPAALVGKITFIEGLDETTSLRKPMHHSATQGDLLAPAAAKSVKALTATSSGATTAVTPPPVAANLPSPYCNSTYGSGELVATLTTAADVYGASIPWLNCAYTPGQIREAYGLEAVSKKYDGTGVKVAILDAYASPTLQADGNRYAVNHKLPALVTGKNFSQIIPSGIYDVSPDETCGPYGWWEEESLDLAAVHGSAPGATILYVGARDCGTSLSIALYNVLYNHLADVATNSYSYGGESIAPGQQATDEQAFLAGGAQGITILFSSGDDGDLAALNGVASGAWPATSAYVTGVGGTSLFIQSDGVKTEYGWGNYRDFLADATVKSSSLVETSGLTLTSAYGYTYDDFSFYSGSGGGISLLDSQPSYQASVVPYALATTLNLASTYTEPLPNPQRVSPDVAMVADPYTGYLYGETFTIAGNRYSDSGCKPISSTEEYCEGGIGGTSLASPLMAGVVAVMNQKRIATGEPVVGFVNPLLYSFGSGGNGANNLNSAPLNQIVAPSQPVAVLRGYADNLNEVRVVTINSVPFNISTAPYGIFTCGIALCEGLDDVFNYTSLSSAGGTPTGYNDVTGLGVPYVPKLLNEE